MKNRRMSSDHLAQPSSRSRNLIGTRPRPIRKEAMPATKMTPVQAAMALGMDTFSLARYLRMEAAAQLRSLADDIERGGESSRGDVDEEEFTTLTAAAWRLVESAKPCDEDWQAR